MRTLAIFGVALLSAAAFLGAGMSVGCGSDSVSGAKGGSKSSTSKAKGGTDVSGDDDGNGDDTAEKGGSKTTSSNAGGSKSTGGSSEQTENGGSSDGSGGSSTTAPTGDSIALTDGLYESSSFSGYLWTAHDAPTEAPASDGSSISPPCGDSGECFKDKACVSGYTAAIPKLASGEFDYSGVWGVSVGWNLYKDDTATQPQDVSSKKSVTVGLAGKIPNSLRVQMDVPSADGSSNTTYCATLVVGTGEGTVKLTSLKTECWGTTGTAFDPATMKPKNISVQATASKTKADFDFCVTKLTLDE